jgi:hypothetical protein
VYVAFNFLLFRGPGSPGPPANLTFPKTTAQHFQAARCALMEPPKRIPSGSLFGTKWDNKELWWGKNTVSFYSRKWMYVVNYKNIPERMFKGK